MLSLRIVKVLAVVGVVTAVLATIGVLTRSGPAFYGRFSLGT